MDHDAAEGILQSGMQQLWCCTHFIEMAAVVRSFAPALPPLRMTSHLTLPYSALI